ncbi:hypothetical protein MLD38_001612 [Melastoma candidum]|uniref:Uncharacterized protein n=1 Tax=Melastoma candidum TaxID=119954 RepID=A0ACB9SDV6_9MYRT|nr:hypothetical protein MLD38_001612 [Melastoma candidum]
MGGLCSRRSIIENVPSGSLPDSNGHVDDHFEVNSQSVKAKGGPTPSPLVDEGGKESRGRAPLSDANADVTDCSPQDNSDGIPRLSRGFSYKSRSERSKQVAVAKVSEVGSLLGKAGGKAVDVLDTLGSSMTNLSLSGNFTSGITTKGNKISILAFEVANTIVKGANLMQSLSKESIKHLKEVVLPSPGVQKLVSRDMEELLRIAANDKREELKVFAGEVVRFGNRCKDPQWHNMERYFEKLGSELPPQKQLKEDSDKVMHQLMELVHCTAELYHELHALDRFEQDYQRKLKGDDKSNASQRGDSLPLLKAELKSQRKHVKSLEKRSLWSRILEEVMEKLVDIVCFLHLEIDEAFGITAKGTVDRRKSLGSLGLALHYANIITQIDTMVSRSGSVPPNSRDTLYQGLPNRVKSSLRAKLQSFQLAEELTIPQIKGEMEKTLDWLAPLATNTTKAHHGFGWVGEWANTGSDVNRKPTGGNDLLRIETLYHADKEKTDALILELVIWLHHLVSQAMAANGCSFRSPIKSPIRSPSQDTVQPPLAWPKSGSPPVLTVEDQMMLRDVNKRKLTPGISKSQEFATAKMRLSKHQRLSKSSSHSPTREVAAEDRRQFRRPLSIPFANFDVDRMRALDVIDRLDPV